MDLPIGDLLVTMGHITKQQLAEALDFQKEGRGEARADPREHGG